MYLLSERRQLLRVLRIAAIVLFVVAVPVFLITTSVRWVINAPVLYSYGFGKYDIPAYTGIERDELLSAAGQIRDYFNNGEELITIQVVVRGIRVMNLYNEREVLHMKDVKSLVRGVYRIQEIAGLYLLAFAAIGLVVWRRRFLRDLAKYVSMGGGLTLALVALVGLGALVGFERLFLAFHLVSFSNDFWQLDPRRDYLIAMFPEAFFFDATMGVAGLTILGAFLLTVVPLVFLRWGRPTDVGGAVRRLAARMQTR